jgi:predicted transcriptional regulator of viral defense system
MISAKTTTEQALTLARELGFVRPRDLAARHLPHSVLAQLHHQGRLERVARGLYRLPDHEATEHFSLAAACRLVPKGVVCLLSALRFHDLGTQDPFQVWMAIHPKAWVPQIDYPPLRIVRFSGPALTEGVEEHHTSDGSVRVYSLPKTVVDCFRYRNKIGLDVALEALQAALRERRATVQALWHYAKLLRMTNVMRPYLEALV